MFKRKKKDESLEIYNEDDDYDEVIDDSVLFNKESSDIILKDLEADSLFKIKQTKLLNEKDLFDKEILKARREYDTKIITNFIEKINIKEQNEYPENITLLNRFMLKKIKLFYKQYIVLIEDKDNDNICITIDEKFYQYYRVNIDVVRGILIRKIENEIEKIINPNPNALNENDLLLLIDSLSDINEIFLSVDKNSIHIIKNSSQEIVIKKNNYSSLINIGKNSCEYQFDYLKILEKAENKINELMIFNIRDFL